MIILRPSSSGRVRQVPIRSAGLFLAASLAGLPHVSGSPQVLQVLWVAVVFGSLTVLYCAWVRPSVELWPAGVVLNRPFSRNQVRWVDVVSVSARWCDSDAGAGFDVRVGVASAGMTVFRVGAPLAESALVDLVGFMRANRVDVPFELDGVWLPPLFAPVWEHEPLRRGLHERQEWRYPPKTSEFMSAVS